MRTLSVRRENVRKKLAWFDRSKLETTEDEGGMFSIVALCVTVTLTVKHVIIIIKIIKSTGIFILVSSQVIFWSISNMSYINKDGAIKTEIISRIGSRLQCLKH